MKIRVLQGSVLGPFEPHYNANVTLMKIIRKNKRKGLSIAIEKTETNITCGGRRLKELEIEIEDIKMPTKDELQTYKTAGGIENMDKKITTYAKFLADIMVL